MHALLQRVTQASVVVDNVRIASIEAGLLVFVGVFPSDSNEIAEKLADRTVDLRIFADDAKPMNRSVIDVGGAVLVVSQFTLAADTSNGRRPSFTSAAPPDQARAFVRGVRRTDSATRSVEWKPGVLAPTCRWRWSTTGR